MNKMLYREEKCPAIGICRTSHRPDECGTRPFLGGSRHLAVDQTCTAAPKMTRSRQHSPKKGCLRCQGINLAPSRRVRDWGDGPLTLEDAGLGVLDMNAGFPESMSNNLDRLPPEPGHTRPDLCTDKHGRSKCVLINGVECLRHISKCPPINNEII